ncbi:MAG TPA: DUF2510 domain-containing protein [Ilumatobacteraceae bacterium]|jgi:hypothetical protein
MSFYPPRLSTFVRIPPQARQMRRMKSWGMHITAGIFAIVCGGLYAFDFALDYKAIASHDTNWIKAATVISIAAAVIGGAMAISRATAGPPLATGGVAFPAAAIVSLIVARIDVSTAFSTSHAKLELAAAITGVIAVFLCTSCFDDKASVAFGAPIAVLAFVPAVADAFLIHIDDFHTKEQIAGIAGLVIIALVILVGALKGRFGVIASIVAATVLGLTFVDPARHAFDRKAAAVVAVIACGLIVVLGLIALILATVGAHSEVTNAAATQDGPKPGQLTDFVPPVAPNMPAYTTAQQIKVAAVVPANTAVAAPAVSSLTTPQWAKDPYGHYEVRYWNGTKWTDHVSTKGVTAIDPV